MSIMLELSKIYNKSYKYNKATKFFNNKQYGGRFEYLNRVKVPTESEIANRQKFMAQCLPEFRKGQILGNKLMKEINAPISEKEFDPEPTIQFIENAFDFTTGIGALRKTKTKDFTLGDLANFYNRNQNILNELKFIYGLFINKSSGVPYTEVSNSMNKLDIIIKQLEADINMLSSNQNQMNLVLNNRSYLEWTKEIADKLKGFYLEKEGTKFLENSVPQNIEVLNTGELRGVVFDLFDNTAKLTGQKLRTDIILYDPNLKVKYRIGNTLQTCTFKEFLNKIQDKTSNVTLNDPVNYTTFQNNLIAGVQAKSGIGAIEFLSKNLKGRNIKPSDVAYRGTQVFSDSALKSLMELFRPPYNSSRLRQTHEYYNALFNYSLGKYLTLIIGKENNLFLTRQGIRTTKQYLIDMFSEGKIMQADKLINLFTDAPVAIKLKRQ